jgi:hypothetical protein
MSLHGGWLEIEVDPLRRTTMRLVFAADPGAVRFDAAAAA